MPSAGRFVPIDDVQLIFVQNTPFQMVPIQICVKGKELEFVPSVTDKASRMIQILSQGYVFFDSEHGRPPSYKAPAKIRVAIFPVCIQPRLGCSSISHLWREGILITSKRSSASWLNRKPAQYLDILLNCMEKPPWVVLMRKKMDVLLQYLPLGELRCNFYWIRKTIYFVSKYRLLWR